MSGQPQDNRYGYLADRYAYYGGNGAQPRQPAAGHASQPAAGAYGQPGQQHHAQQPAAAAAYGQQQPYTGYMPQAYHQYAPQYAQPAAAAAQNYGYDQHGHHHQQHHQQQHMQSHLGHQQPAAYGYSNQPAAGMTGMQYGGYSQQPAGQAPATAEDYVVEQLRPLFPDVKATTLQTAARVYRTAEAAAQWLNTMKQQGMLTGGAGGAAGATGAAATQAKGRSTISIREKFANRAAPGAQVLNRVTSSPSPFGRKPTPGQPGAAGKKRDADDFSDSDASDDGRQWDAKSQYEFELRVLEFLNTATKDSIIDVTACPEDMAAAVIAKRPYTSLTQIQKVDVPTAVKPAPGEKRKRGASKKSAGSRIVDASLSTLRGYEAVDSLIQECAKLGKDVQRGIAAWGVDPKGAENELEIVDIASKEVGGDYFKERPALLAPDIELKNYQQVGINWLSLLYNRRLSCILADEMGLGKTCQIVSFFAHLKEIGQRGPHLVVVPSSTLENWLRELNRFCPNLVVEPYYGNQAERVDIRDNILANGSNFDVMVTTYNLATGSKHDTGFLKSMRFNVCVYDEGHVLKNSQSERYNKLMKIRANFRVILTGTPLQNNLRELVSLLSFILPSLFESNREDLLEVFKFKAKTSQNATYSEQDSRSALLSEQRIIKAKTMMTPFVLRRRKDQVLQLLPAKSHEIVYCEMVDGQRHLYDKELHYNKKGIKQANDEVKAENEAGEPTAGTTKKRRQATLALDNVLMGLRKAALHPLLFRLHYTDSKLKKMTRDIMQEPQYKEANADYILEDMQYMNDFELNRLCHNFPTSMGPYIMDNEAYSNSGKVQKLKELIVPMKAQGDRILIFSQFTQVLDILEKVLGLLDIKFLRLDGQTPVEVRQDLIDQYSEDESITVFLLSTKAGGFGINLATANVVIIFDLSFNPHDDKQAEDRAHRVGQTRTVRVIRMVTKNSIEEAIMQLANTKLALDRQVSEENDEVDPESEALVADLVLENAPTRSGSEAPSLAPADLTSEQEDDEPAAPVGAAPGAGSGGLAAAPAAASAPSALAGARSGAAPGRRAAAASGGIAESEDSDVMSDSGDDSDDELVARRPRRSTANYAPEPAGRLPARRARKPVNYEQLNVELSEEDPDVSDDSFSDADSEEDPAPRPTEYIVKLRYSPKAAAPTAPAAPTTASEEGGEPKVTKVEPEAEPKAEPEPAGPEFVEAPAAPVPEPAAEPQAARPEPVAAASGAEPAKPESEPGAQSEAPAAEPKAEPHSVSSEPTEPTEPSASPDASLDAAAKPEGAAGGTGPEPAIDTAIDVAVNGTVEGTTVEG